MPEALIYFFRHDNKFGFDGISIIAFKDSNAIIMLQIIEDGLEHISDLGLDNLIELRKK